MAWYLIGLWRLGFRVRGITTTIGMLERALDGWRRNSLADADFVVGCIMLAVLWLALSGTR